MYLHLVFITSSYAFHTSQQIGLSFQRPTKPLPYNPFFRSRGRPVPTQEPRLTPYVSL